MSTKFGSFDWLCTSITMPLCSLMASGSEPRCYSRNIEVNTLLIFEPATLVIHLIALIMTTIMIYHIKSKYTAVGRKEILIFFYMYAVSVLLEFFLVSGIIPMANNAYKWFTAIYIGWNMATLWCLLLNGFIGFQWAEDGTPTSLWSIRISSAVVGVISMFIGIGTFDNIAGMSNSNPTGLFIIYMIFSATFVTIYVIFQIVLVLTTLEDRWPLGDILFGFSFFIMGQVFYYVLSVQICEAAKHYVDGMFFGAICTLLSVMMVYKYWDSITKEDLEFSVGSKSNVWELKNPLLSDDSLGNGRQ